MDELELELQRADAAITTRRQSAKELEEELALSKAAIENPRTRGWWTDVGASAVRGPIKAVKAVHAALGALVDKPARILGETFGDITYSEKEGFGVAGPSEIKRLHGKADFEKLITGEGPKDITQEALGGTINALGAPETKTGAVTEGITQFVAGIIPVSRTAKALGVLQGSARAVTAARGLVTGAVTSGLAFEGHEANLANLVEHFPALQNPVTEFLATDAEDSEIVGRLKNAVVDAGGGVVFEGFLVALRAIKAARKLKVEQVAEAADTRADLDLDQVTPAADIKSADAVADEGSYSVTEEALTDEALARFKNAGADSSRPGTLGESETVLQGGTGGAGVPQAEGIRVFRGGREGSKLTDQHFELSHLGKATGRPSSGLGVWFTASDTEAASFGHAQEHSLHFENPKIVDAGDLPAFDSTEHAHAYRKQLIVEGHDGIIMRNSQVGGNDWYVAFKRDQVREPTKVAPKVKPAEKLEPDSTVKALDEKEPGYGDTAEGVSEVRLRKRLGVTDEKLTSLRQRIQRGEVKPEEVSELVGLNGERMDWSGVRNVQDAIGLMNAVSRTFDDVAAGAAGYRKVSIETIAKHASDLGGNMDDAFRLWERLRDAPAHVLAQKATLEASRDRLIKLADKVRSGDHTPADLLEFVTHERRHVLLQITARGTRAQLGRSMRILQEGVKINEDALRMSNARRLREARKAKEAADEAGTKVPLKEPSRLTADEADAALREMGLNTEKVRRLADAIKASKDVNAATRTSLWQTFSDRLSTLYINNILSGLPTMVVNISSGFYKMIESSVELFGSAAIRTIRGADRFERVAASKATLATFTSWRTAWSLAGKAWSEGLPQTDIMARSEVAIRGGAPESLVGKVVTLPSRTILTIDEFFKHIFYRQELTARAVEVAAEAARLEKGRAAQDATLKRVLKETLAGPSDDLVLDAIEAARYNTFQSNLKSKFANNLIKLTNDTPITKLVVPFIKTPTNIIKQGAERTPLALLRPKVWKALVGQGDRESAQIATRAILGTTAVAIAWNWADEGRITGSRVGNGANKNTADLKGAPQYSIRIGDTWYQYNRLDPLGTVLGLTADLRAYVNDRAARAGNEIETDDPEALEWFGNLIGILNENMLDKTFFKGLSDFFSAMEGGESAGTMASNYISNVGTNLVPFSSMLRNIARAHDGYAREAFNFADKLLAGFPGQSEQLPLKRDVLGRPIENTERVGADWLSPFIVGKDDPDPAAKALAEIEMGYRMPNKDIAGIKLSEEQYSRLLEVRGSYIREQLNEWLTSGEWAGLTKHQKIEKVRRWFHTGTTEAEGAVLDQYPDLGLLVEGRKEEVKALRSGELGE